MLAIFCLVVGIGLIAAGIIAMVSGIFAMNAQLRSEGRRSQSPAVMVLPVSWFVVLRDFRVTHSGGPLIKRGLLGCGGILSGTVFIVVWNSLTISKS